MRCSCKTPMNGGANGGSSRASCSITATPRRPIGWCAQRRSRTIPSTAPNCISWPAGSRCASSPIPPRRSRILRISTTARPTRSLSRARLGLGELELRPPPAPADRVGSELLHAAELLYTVGERDLVLTFVTDLAGRSDDTGMLAAVADLAVRNDDARAVMLTGKAALARGLPLEFYAFPDIGVPRFSPIGPGLPRSIVYSVARTESEFNQRDRSPAQAVGLMQVTPEAGRDTAKRFSVGYDWKRLVTDPVYNTQMGAAELAALLREY